MCGCIVIFNANVQCIVHIGHDCYNYVGSINLKWLFSFVQEMGIPWSHTCFHTSFTAKYSVGLWAEM